MCIRDRPTAAGFTQFHLGRREPAEGISAQPNRLWPFCRLRRNCAVLSTASPDHEQNRRILRRHPGRLALAGRSRAGGAATADAGRAESPAGQARRAHHRHPQPQGLRRSAHSRRGLRALWHLAWAGRQPRRTARTAAPDRPGAAAGDVYKRQRAYRGAPAGHAADGGARAGAGPGLHLLLQPAGQPVARAVPHAHTADAVHHRALLHHGAPHGRHRAQGAGPGVRIRLRFDEGALLQDLLACHLAHLHPGLGGCLLYTSRCV